jgi:hypothetical protein
MLRTLLLLPILLLPTALYAQPIRYTQLEALLGYFPQVTDEDLLGFELRGSWQLDVLDPSLFLYGGHQQLEDRHRITRQHLGLGYYAPVDVNTEVWIGVGADRHQGAHAGWLDDHTYPTFRAGIREQFTDVMELYVGFRFLHHDQAIKGYTLGMRLAPVSSALAWTLELDHLARQTGLQTGITWRF